MALPDGCGKSINPPSVPTPDFIVSLLDNSVQNPTDNLEQRFIFAINNEAQKHITLDSGKTYTFLLQFSCNHAFVITEDPEFGALAYIEGITGQFGCLHQFTTLTLKVDNNTPTSLFYQCALHPNMGGNITVVKDPVPSGNDITNDSVNNIGTVIGLAIAFVIVALVAIFLIIYIFRKMKLGTRS